MSNIISKFADDVRNTEQFGAVAFLTEADACLRRAKKANSEGGFGTCRFWTQQRCLSLLQAVGIVHGDKGLSAETMLRVAAELSERL